MATESPLNEAQRRRIFSNAQYADKLLSDVEAILSASESKSIFPKYVADLSPPQVKLIRSYIARFRNQLPRAIVVNKLDRERADFQRALASVQENFGRTAVPIHLPMGAERDFNGIVDLIRMRAFTY